MNYTMVIADDEQITLKSEELLLQQEFPEIEIVGMALNGIELKQMLEQLQPDMALVDVRMPGLTGIEVIELLQHKCRTHFVLNTAYSDFEYVKQALDLRADAYLLKPGKKEDTIETIRKLCETVRSEKEEIRRQERMNSAVGIVRSVLGSEVLLSIFSGECDAEGFRVFCDMQGISFSYGCIATFLPNEQTGISTKELDSAFEEILGGLCRFLMTVTANGVVVMFLIPEELEAERRETWCRELAELTANCLKEKTGTDYRYGIGGIYDSFSDMQASYHESVQDLCVRKKRGGEENQDAAVYVTRVLQYVAGNYRKTISLQDAAAYVGISPYYLSHIFKEQTGQNFVEYLSAVRIEEAKRLASDSDLTIKEIAKQCGYMNVTYFCRVFKRMTGMTIGEYRRQ